MFDETSSKDTEDSGKLTKSAFLLVEIGEKTSRLIDSKAAKEVAHRLKLKLCYDSESKSWHSWSENHWRPIYDKDKAISVAAKIVDEGCGKKGYRQCYLNGIVSQIQVTGVLERPARPKSVIPFMNGLLCISTGVLKPATPDSATDWVLPHAYNELTDCENIKTWLLDTVDGDRETFNLLRAWLAALIRGLPLQYILMLIGPGGTGKGVFQRLAVATIGDANTATSTLHNLEYNRFETAKHYGKALCLINEAGRFGGQLSTLKSMSGRDPLALERKHQQQSGSYVYGGLVLLVTNDDIESSDSGIERRRVAVRFSKRVSPIQREDWQQRGGEETVLHSEIPGLIRWLLDMPIQEIYRSFENLPDRVHEENFSGMRAGGSVADWVLDECFFDPEVENQVGQFKRDTKNNEHLYPAYRQWCEENGIYKPVPSNKFKRKLLDIGARLNHELDYSKNEKRQTIIRGIRLNSRK